MTRHGRAIFSARAHNTRFLFLSTKRCERKRLCLIVCLSQQGEWGGVKRSRRALGCEWGGVKRTLEVRVQIFAGFDARNSPGSVRRAVSALIDCTGSRRPCISSKPPRFQLRNSEVLTVTRPK